MSEKVSPEFSRPVDIIRLNQLQKITANSDELAAIAKRLELPALSKLDAELVIKRGRGDVLQVEGRFKAVLAQTCVVSLEDFPVELDEAVEATYSEGSPLPLYESLTLEDDDPDAPEPVINGKIDLGELVVQSLSLALDPYPHKPGTEFTGYDK